jgi:Ca2+-binding RTX toxin-like protein
MAMIFCMGGDGADYLQGESGRDFIEGGLGHDYLSGGAWHDTLNGGDGDDTIDGGLGNDELIGGAGNDIISGSFGDDLIHPGQGGGIVNGGTGKDTLTFIDIEFGISVWDIEQVIEVGLASSEFALVEYDEVEVIYGSNFRDRFQIIQDSMVVFGGAGNDFFDIRNGVQIEVDMGSGDDVVYIFGDAEATVSGGIGNDTFFATAGESSLTGGLGDDTFYLFSALGNEIVFELDGGSDTVYDFDIFHDTINFGDLDREDIFVSETDLGAQIFLDDDSSILLIGVFMSDYPDYFSFG